MVTCEGCGKEFENEAGLGRHARFCPGAGYKFTNRFDDAGKCPVCRNRHRKFEDVGDFFVCLECGLKFLKPSELEKRRDAAAKERDTRN